MLKKIAYYVIILFGLFSFICVHSQPSTIALTQVPTIKEVQESETIPAEQRMDSPLNIPGAITIDVKKAEAFFRAHMIFIDVRRNNDWNSGHIPQAYHLFLDKDFTENNLKKIVPTKSTEFVIYCNGYKCWRSAAAVGLAIKWGYKKVYYFRDGFPAWQLANDPIE